MPEDTGHKVEVKVTWKQRCLNWMDSNPRVGWWVAFLSIVNVLLNVLDLTK